jgi:hypothetical protein
MLEILTETLKGTYDNGFSWSGQITAPADFLKHYAKLKLKATQPPPGKNDKPRYDPSMLPD